ncbi:MAG: flippase-like domain-containing protein [Bernardetiaceae bacterium]|nr:flippase-like domain-containing protein [Bernardetiaceae bacterium]
MSKPISKPNSAESKLEEEKKSNKKVFKTLNPNSVYIPVAIGLAVAVYLFIDKVNIDVFVEKLVAATWWWFGVALIVLLSRDAGYIYRIRMLTGKRLTWKASIYVILLWEFASAVTPSVVGGTAVAVFILNKEKLSLGKSFAFAMLTAFFDNFFFIIFAPLALIATNLWGMQVFPNISMEGGWLQDYGLQVVFYVSYALIVLYNFIFAYGLFFNPRGFKWILVKITSIGWLKRFRNGALETGTEVIMASKELKGKDFNYWLKATLSTIFIWTSRYFMLNCLVAAFSDMNMLDHLLAFSRQIIMWIVMLISPTPGSSGAAEGVFCLFYSEFLSNDFCAAVGILWRLFYYYPYLFIGALILPRWIKRVYAKK